MEGRQESYWHHSLHWGYFFAMHHGLNACKRNGISRECCTGRAVPGAGMAAGRQSCSSAGERGLPGEKKPKQPGKENTEELGIAEF